MSESKRAYSDVMKILEEHLESLTVIIVKGDGGEISTVTLGVEEKDDIAQAVPFADGVGIFIHFGVIDTPHEPGVIVIDGVTPKSIGVGK